MDQNLAAPCGGFTVEFAVYDGRRNVGFKARAQLHADWAEDSESYSWASIEALSGTQQPQWVELPTRGEDTQAAEEHLVDILTLAEARIRAGEDMAAALAAEAERCTEHAHARETEQWAECGSAHNPVGWPG